MRHAALLVIGNCANEKADFEAQEGPPAQFAEPVPRAEIHSDAFYFLSVLPL